MEQKQMVYQGFAGLGRATVTASRGFVVTGCELGLRQWQIICLHLVGCESSFLLISALPFLFLESYYSWIKADGVLGLHTLSLQGC